MGSRSSPAQRARTKLADYFHLPSARHYLAVQPERRHVICGRRAEDRDIATGILAEDALPTLDPPGIEVRISDFILTV